MLRRGNLNAAEQLFEQAIQSEPENALGYYDLGVVDQQAGQRRQALREYNLALAKDTRYVPAMYNEAVIYGTRNVPLAIFFYHKVITIQADSPTAYLNIGLLEVETKSLRPEALIALGRAVKLDPSLLTDIPASLRAQLSKTK